LRLGACGAVAPPGALSYATLVAPTGMRLKGKFSWQGGAFYFNLHFLKPENQAIKETDKRKQQVLRLAKDDN
jgi:hypothetical protein